MLLTLHATAAGDPITITLNAPDPEVVVLTSVMPKLGLRLKSTYLSRLGEPPVLVSHWATYPGTDNRPRPVQREAHDMVGRSLEHRCLLDHLTHLQEWIELSGQPATIALDDAQLDRLPTYS